MFLSSLNVAEDHFIWSKVHHDFYSVRSAYKLIQTQKKNLIAANSTGFWNKFWNLKVPLKALNLVRRAASNCLPTLTQLSVKRVLVQIICLDCQRAYDQKPRGDYSTPYFGRGNRGPWNPYAVMPRSNPPGFSGSSNGRAGDGAQFWIKPQENTIKVTVDSAIFVIKLRLVMA
ncbi:hypothetical protein G4B88_022191 [Cannabis sativa]|uniref:Reverse transcriptase zinc-binding domain-containing protein n=1 Tax=Cannabis sativa TaxID=3483 RepID=A0A7J6FXS3_CANSA|nr:hypothetical protein G4B88_022191 [Cannabis sativa]